MLLGEGAQATVGGPDPLTVYITRPHLPNETEPNLSSYTRVPYPHPRMSQLEELGYNSPPPEGFALWRLTVMCGRFRC